MKVWDLKTYKKDKNNATHSAQPKSRNYVVLEAYDDDTTQKLPPPIQFVRNSNEELLIVLKEYERHEYERHLHSDTARFIHSVWFLISGHKTVEDFMRTGNEPLQIDREKFFDCLSTLECLGDLFLAGGALQDAFDFYSRLLHLRLILKPRDLSLLTRNVINCAQSAWSIKQQKLSSKLLEHCVVYLSITKGFGDTVSATLRDWYISRSPVRDGLPDLSGDEITKLGRKKLSDTILSILKSPDMTISYALVSADSPLGLDSVVLALQHAIYFHLWQRLGLLSALEHPVWPYQPPSLRHCRLLANISHKLAQRLVDECSEGLLEQEGSSLSSAIIFHLPRLIDIDSYTRWEIEQNLVRASKKSSDVQKWQTSLQSHGNIDVQCLGWLQDQALIFVSTRGRLDQAEELPRRHESEEGATGTTEVFLNNTDAMDIDMSEIRPENAPHPSTIVREASLVARSIYLRTSSLRSSEYSMRSLASRIKRNARNSVMTISSQLSGNSVAMSLAGSFDFARVTGMGVELPRPQSMDVIMIDEGLST
jgi:hypothetical protein